MVKISLAKILGHGISPGEVLEVEQDALLSGAASPKRRRSCLPTRTLYSLIAGILIIQALITYRLFYYEPPLSAAPLYDSTTTVALVTKWYELLREMRYLGPNAIAYPPHVGEKAINVTLAKRMGLDDRVIETMQQLPYIDDTSGGWMLNRDILFRNGHFIDYRKDENLYVSRDPLGHWLIYNAKHTEDTFEQAMLDFDDLFPKSAVPLSAVKGGMWASGLAIVLDTATNRIHVISTGGDNNHDPFFEQFQWNAIPLKYKIKTDFYGPLIQHARQANHFLQDLIMKTARLDVGFVPGVYLESYAPELSPPKWEAWIRDLYQKSGWPSADVMEEFLFPENGTSVSSPFQEFEVSKQDFSKEILELRHNITVKYMPDWYIPVPRTEEFISKCYSRGMLTEEQVLYARSDEEVIPLDLNGWGGRFLLTTHWEVYD